MSTDWFPFSTDLEVRHGDNPKCRKTVDGLCHEVIWSWIELAAKLAPEVVVTSFLTSSIDLLLFNLSVKLV